jgi:uncharacterized protein YcsI (UPF0317 family)
MTTNTAKDVRMLCRSDELPTYPSTTGLAPGHIQANLVIIPEKYAANFRSLCQRNPVPCPLIGESLIGYPTTFIPSPGTCFTSPLFSEAIDVRTDLPKYQVYRHGKLVESPNSVEKYWKKDSIAFLIGCSYSFETALVRAGLPPRHHRTSTAVPMYRTTVPLNPAGVFTRGTYVVSMRPYRASDVETVRKITAAYQMTGHGEPIAWGWEGARMLGIKDIDKPEWGVAVKFEDQEVPVFWGCGVTPQNCLVDMGEEIDGDIIAHYPGGMLVCDLREEEITGT